MGTLIVTELNGFILGGWGSGKNGHKFRFFLKNIELYERPLNGLCIISFISKTLKKCLYTHKCLFSKSIRLIDCPRRDDER